MTTAQKIINLLNRQQLTINQLAQTLGISRNSVHLQVGKLEAAGSVEKCRRGQPAGAGKPAFHYRTVAGHEDSFSVAYKPLLGELIQTISAELPEVERLALFEGTGRSLANNAALEPTGDLDIDIQQALEAVNALGAMAELTDGIHGQTVCCYSCPVATLVHSDPLVCRLVAAFFAAATGKSVESHCRHQGTVVCAFSFSRP